MNLLKTSLTILILSLALVGCSEQTVTKENASPEVQAKLDGATTKEEVKEEVKEVIVEEVVEEVVEEKAKVGDTLNVSGVKVTVVDIEKYTGEINQFSPLAEDHAVKINVIIENTTDSEVMVMDNSFKLYDIDGFELASALASGETPLMATLPTGKKTKGAILFDVPVQEGTWELHFEEMFSFSGDLAIWEVEAK